MKEIYQVMAHPSTYDGPEDDREIGYYDGYEQAVEEAIDWVKRSRPPHTQDCCVWDYEIRTIVLNETRPYFGR